MNQFEITKEVCNVALDAHLWVSDDHAYRALIKIATDSLERAIRDASDRWDRVSSWVSYDALQFEYDRLEETGEDPERYSELDEILYEYSTVTSDLCTHFDILGGLRDAPETFKETARTVLDALAENLETIKKWEGKYLKQS